MHSICTTYQHIMFVNHNIVLVAIGIGIAVITSIIVIISSSSTINTIGTWNSIVVHVVGIIAVSCLSSLNSDFGHLAKLNLAKLLFQTFISRSFIH